MTLNDKLSISKSTAKQALREANRVNKYERILGFNHASTYSSSKNFAATMMLVIRRRCAFREVRWPSVS